ncbi:YitT family protein [uncultured Intestinimonas sp.]|uniref:YitT family protein n=1 Tax=uncultured Intestinimonas sp. TaxID=1689265 RepID=UPI0025FAC887|nr:YitT family protein [uncultured Intestinimonas sp.]
MRQQNWLTKKNIQEFLFMTLGITLVSVGVYFFKFPNHFSIGGVSGLAIVLAELIPVPWLTASVYNGVINILFLLLGFLLLDKGFGFRTVYCSILYSLEVQVFEWIFLMSAPLTDQLILELFFAVLLPALGSGILFNLDASSGGTDIAAMILKKYTGLDVGRALLCSDVLIAASALLVFDVTAGLCSLLGLVLKSVLVDTVIESLNRRKAFMVITYRPEIVTKYIIEDLNRGATIWSGQGAYTHETHQVVLTVLARHQAVQLRRYLKQNDPHAFMIVTNSSEIFGKGFLRA